MASGLFLQQQFTFEGSDALASLFIVAASFVLAKVVYFILSREVKKLTSKTRTSLDDRVLAAAESPIFLAIVPTGIYFGLLNLTLIAPYATLVTKAYVALLIAIAGFFVMRVGDAALSWYAEEVAPKTKSNA